MTEDVKKAFDTFWDKLIPCREELVKDGKDYIRDKITDLFRGRIGQSPANQEELNQIYLEGEQRYKISRPPGFCDQSKSKNNDNQYLWKGLVFKKEYGDLMVWKQILKQVKFKSLTHIIFITGDNKEDWWRREHGKTIGPRPELVEEISEAGASLFHMYTPDNFLRYAKDYLQLEIAEKSIQQVEEVSVSNSLSEPELDADFSRQSSGSDHYDLSNIQRLITSAASIVSAASMVPKQLSVTSIVSAASMVPKQLSVLDMTQLTNIDRYGLRNITNLMTEYKPFINPVNQVVNNDNNRLMAQMAKQAAIPNHLMASVNKVVENNNNRLAQMVKQVVIPNINHLMIENDVQEDNDSSMDSSSSEQLEPSEDSSF